MKRSTRWAGLMLAAALLFALAAPGVLAAESTVSIRTAEVSGAAGKGLHSGHLVPGEDGDPGERP